VASKSIEAGQAVQQQVVRSLNKALQNAEKSFLNGVAVSNGLSVNLIAALKEISDLSQKASTGFTNIVTCLAIKAARPNVDIRYHQVQIQGQTDRGAGFNFRGVSEKIVYP
jgi:DNA (cytosine-5)-methyltransferase 1